MTGQSPRTIALGFALMLVAAVLVGLVNGFLIRFANFTAIAATLAMYIGLQGVSFLFRDAPGGYISYRCDRERSRWKLGPVPVAFLVLIVAGLAGGVSVARHPARLAAARGRLQRGIRAADRRAHQPRLYRRLCRSVSLFAALGAVMLMAQIGVGDPAQGANYTLASITAVVLGGTSLRGGRGTFIGTVLGAVLADRGAEHGHLPGTVADLSVCVPGRADPRRRADLFHGARQDGGIGQRSRKVLVTICSTAASASRGGFPSNTAA